MGRKKTHLLIEDFNQIPTEALVPEIEQPYPIPAHWKWVRLGALCQLNPPKVDTSSIPLNIEVSFFPMTAISEVTGTVENSEVRVLSAVSKGYTNFVSGDVLFAKITPCMENGKSAVVPPLLNGLGFGSTEFYVLRPSRILNPKFLHTFVRQKSFRAQARKVMAGAVGQQRVPKHFIDSFPFPLPPLDEQEQIVEQLTIRTEKIDTVLEKLTGFLQSSSERRSALIQAGVNGQLTASWRDAHGISIEDWDIKPFERIAKIRTHLVDPHEFEDFPHIAPDSIETGTGRLLDFRTVAEDGVKSGKHRFFPNQILYSKIRPYLAKVVKVDFEGLCSADMYPIEAMQSQEFLLYLMLSTEFVTKSSNAGSRTVLPKINQKELNALSFRIPSAEEQIEIARRLDLLISQHDALINLLDTVKSKLMQSKQDIISAVLAGRYSVL